jgi:hypothetical protein
MIRWFRQYWAIAKNAFVVCLSDPVYLVLLLCMLVLMALFASLPTFNFGEELRLIRDQSLALCFLGGCIVAVVGAATALVRDMRSGTVSILLSRPVSSLSFVLGKWTGIAGAIALYQVTATVACLWATRLIGTGGHGEHLDMLALALYAAAIVVALGLVALKHYFMGGWYVWQASLAVCGSFVLAFLVLNFLGGDGRLQPFGLGVNWPTAQACLLLLLAQLLFSALLLPVAIEGGMVSVMVAGVVFFFAGLLAEHLLAAALPPGWLATTVKALVPNWQVFWISDFLATERPRLAPGFVAACLAHTALYSTACLLIAALLFNRRELTGHDTL